MMGRRPTALHPNPWENGGLRLEGAAKQAMETGRNRLLITGFLFAVGFLMVGLRLVEVSLFQEGTESRLAGPPPTATFQMERGDIVDRNGVLLATSLATASLYADPARVLDAKDAARRLVQVLPELSKAEVLAKLQAKRRFVWLRRNLTPRQQYAVNRLGIPGLYFRREERRVYPHGRLVAHLVGFTGVDNNGLAGIERYFDDALRGGTTPLALSLDIRIQHILHAELSRAMAEYEALGAAGLVLDASTGEVLAMVSLPDFDPNQPGAAGDEARFNRGTLGVYEMGSTFKIFTAAMALDAGTATLDNGYDATEPIRIARFTIRDFKPQRRWLSVPEIFMYSSNIGAAKMALDVGTNGQQEFFERLGFLRPARIELPEVGTPIAPSPWREINTMTIAFGYGLAISPLQLANGTAAIVNGGVLHRPTLLKRRPDEPVPGTQVISPRTSEKMRRLLRLVVLEGTGKNAAAPGYLVGGKTGTAEKMGAGVYLEKALLSSFVGAFPMTDPRYVVLALLDEPHGNERTFGYATGGWVAAPVVGRVIERIAPLVGVAPVDEDSPELREAFYVNLDARGRNLASF